MQPQRGQISQSQLKKFYFKKLLVVGTKSTHTSGKWYEFRIQRMCDFITDNYCCEGTESGRVWSRDPRSLLGPMVPTWTRGTYWDPEYLLGPAVPTGTHTFGSRPGTVTAQRVLLFMMQK